MNATDYDPLIIPKNLVWARYIPGGVFLLRFEGRTDSGVSVITLQLCSKHPAFDRNWRRDFRMTTLETAHDPLHGLHDWDVFDILDGLERVWKDRPQFALTQWRYFPGNGCWECLERERTEHSFRFPACNGTPWYATNKDAFFEDIVEKCKWSMWTETRTIGGEI